MQSVFAGNFPLSAGNFICRIYLQETSLFAGFPANKNFKCRKIYLQYFLQIKKNPLDFPFYFYFL